MKIKLQEVPKSHSNYTDINNTDFSDTESNPSIQTVPSDKMDEMEAYRAIIHENIEYDSLCQQYDKEEIEGMVELMIGVLVSAKPQIRIAGEDVPAAMVKSRFMKLNYSHMQYIFECLSKNTTKVGNIKQYLLATMYNAPATIGNYYRAEVNHDMWGS